MPVVDAVLFHLIIENAIGDVDIACGLMDVAVASGKSLFQALSFELAYFFMKVQGMIAAAHRRGTEGVVLRDESVYQPGRELRGAHL